MKRMNWEKLLTDCRFGLEDFEERPHNRTDHQRDYDRLIFSSAFRRLQNKTQVFPLPDKIFVHNRLTHSLEVSCVGRSLGTSIGKDLQKKYPSSSANFNEIGSIVAAACLAHDMGNPPFGHSGERAISAYFQEGKGKRFEKQVREEGRRWEDFTMFEGNANAIRLLTHQFIGRRKGGYALTYSTLASIVKYPYSSKLSGSYGKFGFFESEEESYARIANRLGIIKIKEHPSQYVRYPLVYLVEAADDICYQIMDIEDAYKMRILSFTETCDILMDFFEEEHKGHITQIMHLVNDKNEQIAYLRSSIIGLLIDECARVFIKHEDDIMEGRFQSTLIKEINLTAQKAYKNCTKLAYAKIYSTHEVVDIELAGHRIFEALLDKHIDALLNPEHAYSKLLMKRMSKQYDTNVAGTYGKIQCVLDYISGMTDNYALDLYRKITGMSLPAL